MSKELIKLPELGKIPPPIWVDLLNTDDANKFLDEFVGQLYYDYIDPTYSLIMNIFQVVQDALDFVASLIPEFTDPISLLLNEIIEFVEAYLKDLKQTGIYFTFDDAFKGERKLEKFKGGYNRVAQEIVRKATNPSDYSRPDVSNKTAVLSITVYGGAGIDGWTNLVKAFDSFMRLFGVTELEGGFLPPQVLPYLFLSQVGPTTVSLELDKLELLDFDPVGFVPQWQMPQGKVNNFFEINLPPASFVLTITSRARPLPLFLEIKTQNDTKFRTVVVPLYVSKERNEQATSLILDRLELNYFVDEVSESMNKPFLFARDPSGKKIPAKKLKNETISFYKRTTNLGAVFGQTTFELELKYDEDLGELRTYDIDTDSEVKVSDNYYYSVASYEVESPTLEAGFNLTDKPQPFNSSTLFGEGFTFVYQTEKDRHFLSLLSSKTPRSSRTQTVKLNYPSRMNYMKAMREAMTHVILYLLEHYNYTGTSLEGILSRDTEKKVYNLLHIKDVGELAKKTEYFKLSADGYNVSEINDFRDNVKSLVDDGVTRMLGRDEPSKIINVVQPFIDTVLNDSEYPLLYPTLEYEFSGFDNSGYFEDGTFKLTNLDDLSKLNSVLDVIPFVNIFSEPSDVQGIFPDGRFAVEESSQGRIIRKKVAEEYFNAGTMYGHSQSDNIHISFEKESKYAQFKYGQYKTFQNVLTEYPEKLKASFNLLGFIPENKLDREGAWKFIRLFPDGIVSVDEIFEEILKALKLLKDGFDSLVKFILDAIALLKQRIESIRQFVVKIKALIDAILALRFPAGLSYLLTISEGTEGYVDAIMNAENPPESGIDIYGTYATLVIPSAVPSIVVQILLGMLGDEAQEKVANFFDGGTEIDPLTGERKAVFGDGNTQESEIGQEAPELQFNTIPSIFEED